MEIEYMDRQETNSREIASSQLAYGEIDYKKCLKTEEERLYQKVFSPNIKRKPYKRGVIKRVCEGLVKSFFPATKISYAAMERRLLTQFNRGDPKTVLLYLGRPAYRQVQKMNQTIVQNSGSKAKEHTFTRDMKAKVGYVQKYGFATLYDNRSKGETYFVLHHTEQTKIDSPLTLPPTETLKESASEWSEALEYAKQHSSNFGTIKKSLPCNSERRQVCKKPVLQANTTVTDGEERETYTGERKIEVSESNLSKDEIQLFRVLERSVKEGS